MVNVRDPSLEKVDYLFLTNGVSTIIL